MSLKRKTDAPDKNDAAQKKGKPNTKVGNERKAGSTKSKKMAKETAATRRDRKRTRKMQKPNYEISQQALKLWEKLRRNKAKVSKKECAGLVDELMEMVKKMDKKIINLTYAHDTSRVLQTCLKQGSPEQRCVMYDEFKGEIIDMCKNRYAKNVVWKLLKYGTPDQRNEIIHQFSGQVPKLIRKEGPASIIEFAYNVYANKEQRKFLTQQFYGNSFNVTKSKDDDTLQDVLREQPEKKKIILQNFKQSLVPLVEKQVIMHTIVHRVYEEFFEVCDDEQLRSELIELLRASVIHIMHTRDGARVAMQCLWHGTAKDRKVIVKTMKEFLSKLCQEEYGHLVLLAAFDCVDDTVFLKKSLILPLVNILPEVIHNKYAKKVLLYLVSPRNPSHFLPETIQFLSKGDNNANSKKPLETRHKELSEAVSPGLIEYVTSHIRKLSRDKSLFVLVEAAINSCQGDISGVIVSLNELVSEPFEAGRRNEDGEFHIIEDPAGHLLIKRLVGHKKSTANEVVYARSLLDAVAEDDICLWCSCTRGSHVLLSLLQCSDLHVADTTRALLLKKMKIVEKQKGIKSTSMLLEKICVP